VRVTQVLCFQKARNWEARKSFILMGLLRSFECNLIVFMELGGKWLGVWGIFSGGIRCRRRGFGLIEESHTTIVLLFPFNICKGSRNSRVKLALRFGLTLIFSMDSRPCIGALP
jgi:hypothetical protein